MDRRRVIGSARRHVRVAAVVTALALVVGGVTLAALPRGEGAHPGWGILQPGSIGSLTSHHAWWDPRGWFGGRTQPPKPHTITAIGGPHGTRMPRQAVVPRPRRVRELTSRRTANTRVYQLSDGRRQAVISAAPVNYRDAAGRWQPIDTTVRSSTRPGYRYGNTSNTFGSFFGASPAKLVRFQAPGGGWLQMGLDGAQAARPRLAGDTVSYPGVAPGAGLSYQVTPTALKENITLASASAASSFSFTVKVGGGLAPYQRAGQIVFSRTGVGGPAVLVMPRPFMTDARHDAWSPYGFSWSPKVSQRLRWDPVARTLQVTVTPDAGWLRQRGRRFPVVIDPTINIAPPPGQAQSTVISSDTPNTAYGSSWPLSVGTTPTGAVRSLLQFTMPTWIPAGTQIDSADLRLYRDQSFGTSPATQTIEVHQATGPWDSSATWTSASGLAGAQGLNQVTVDDTDGSGNPNPDTARTGAWQTATVSAATNGEYVYDQDSTSGDTFTWVPQLTESGNYNVVGHYVATSNAATNAPFTVNYNGGSQAYSINQQSGTGGVWASLGTHRFVAGNTGSVVLGDGPASTSTRVIADTMTFKLWGQAVVNPSAANVWDSFPVRSIVQSWLDTPMSNYGLVVKTADESTLGQGGPMYEGSVVNAFGGETATNPQLVITYGRPSAVLNQITTIRGDGADLSWTPYTDPTPGTFAGDDLGEYQVHRSTKQTFNPTNANLVAPVAAGTTSYSDTSATPTPASATSPSVVYYMVMVKTVGGMLVPGPTQKVILPKAGFTTQVINASGATTLSQAQPTTPEQHLTGQPWLAAGDNSTTYGVTRTVVNFPSLASQQIPATAVVTDAELKLWGWSNSNTGGGPATYEAHALTQDFDPATATWNNASTGTPWTTAGGSYSSGVTGTVSGLTNDPASDQWPVTSAVQGWVSTSASQHGLLVKQAAETGTSPQEQELFLDTSAAEPALRPQLLVTYLNATTEDTYSVPTLPDDLTSGTTYTVPVTVTNTTGTTLSKASWVLSYHWSLPDGTDVSAASNQLQTALSADLPAGATVTIQAQLKTPDTTGTGNIRTGYTLGWDLYNTSTHTWLSQTNPGLPQIPPLNQPASVVQPGPALLGLEKYYQYTGVNTGSGSALLNNDATGNVVWSYNAFSNPSRGFATFVRLAYNSMDTSDSSMGFGWSLQTSTLMRLGTPLDFHPNPQDNSATATLTDGDGTTHIFTRSTSTSPWVSPPGFHYFLEQKAQCDPSGSTQEDRAWVMTRPDRTQFWFDCQGYQSAVIDRNGNEADFTYEDRTSNNQPVKFLDYITDPTGRQTLTLSYYHKGDNYSYIDANGNVASGTNLTNPKIIDQVKSITDISGRTITFLYTTQGLMAQMTDGDGAGTQLAKVFKFGYDMTQGNKNVKLVSVTDPRSNTTQLAYYTAPQDPKFKWSLETITDRRANTVGFAYTEPATGQPSGSVQTVVTDQNNHSSTYALDPTGRPVQVTDAKGQQTQLAWDGDNNVTSLTEDNGAKTTWTYDPNTGYPLTMTDAKANHDGTAGTTYTYNTGLNGHIADLASLLTPQQRLWTFGYDPNGNLTSVTDPDGNAAGAAAGSYTTNYRYFSDGDLHTATDANGNTTTYSNYDVTGYPQTITDAIGNATQYTYDPRGNVLSVSDPFQEVTSYSYDVFGRLGQIVVPKDHNANPPVFITIPAPVYDGNDNIKQSTDATGAVTSYTYNANDQLASKSLPPDDSAGTLRQYTYIHDPAGNLTSVTEPDGNAPGATSGSFTTTYGYDAVNELTSVTDAANDPTIYGYDDVGNRTSVTDPLHNLTQQAYNLNHWPTVATDAANHTTSTTYDLDGLVTDTTDQNNNTTHYTLDPRGDVIQVMVPHDTSGGTTTYNTTQYVYDQVGNRTQVLTPRALAAGYSRSSTCIATQTCGYTYVTHYDADNRVSAQLSAYAPNGTYNTPAETDYTYNAVGRLKVVTAPASGSPPTGGPNITKYTYWDNNWVKSSTDPWNITTSYDYNNDGQQASRTIASDDRSADGPTPDNGSMSRTQAWTYYPGGQLRMLTDDGVPTGAAAEMVDNSDTNNTSSTPLPPAASTWTPASTASGFAGYNYQTHAAGSGTDTFTWNLHIPADGNYTVYVKYPVVPGAATSASFKVFFSGGSATTAVNQTANTAAGGWVSLGKHAFTQAGTGQKVTLTQNSGGIVVADAVKVVRDTAGVTNTAHHAFTYSYDPTGNLTGIADNSTPSPAIASYAMTYDQVNRLTQVQEKDSSSPAVVKHTTSYGYDAASNLTSRGHDSASSTYAYDSRNLLITEADKASASDPSQTTMFSYTPDLLRQTETKPNGNVVTYTYFADRLLRTQVEDTSAGTLVDSHTYGYNGDGVKNSDTEQLMSADSNSGGTYLTHTLAYSNDPRDRLSQVTKDGTITEQYVHDATDNVTSQTLGTTTTTFTYDRDRLLAAATGATTATYNYDPLGRLDTVTSTSGTTTTTLERNTYDGFDNIASHQQLNSAGTGMDTTGYTYDPLNRQTSQAVNGGAATQFAYLGLSPDLITETQGGTPTKSYTYTPAGERLSQTTAAGPNAGTGYYTYNGHNDVEAITNASTGNTTATYGYTAYGQPDTSQFTGADKTTTSPSATNAPFSSYRFNAMRWDPSSGQYDMGFRNYAPTLNQFLTRDMYNGALTDMTLTTDPFTGNRYTFAAGNPLSNIELDGHTLLAPPGGGGCAPTIPGCTGYNTTSGSGGGGGLLGSLWHGFVHTVVPVAAGTLTGLGCEAVTAGTATPLCAAAGGFVGGYVSSAINTHTVFSLNNVKSGLVGGAIGLGAGLAAPAIGGVASRLLGNTAPEDTVGAGDVSEAFHYTRVQNLASIRAKGLLPGSYATPNGELSPLQAQIDLALPPNRGLPSAMVRVDVAGLRSAGYDIPEVTQVGRGFNMPGGGSEMQFPYQIPPEFLKVIWP